MNFQNNRLRTILLCLLLAAAVAILYLPVRHFPFIDFDDTIYVSANSHIQEGLNWAQVKWAFQSGHCSNWHPLTWLSHMLDWQLFGADAGSHHLTSVFLHLANTLLLFLLWQRMTGMIWRSAFLAALFALHPLRVESVAWVAERKDVLSTFFGLLALLSYHRYAMHDGCRAPGEKKRLLSYLLTCIFYLFSLMSKSMLVTLPFLFLLLDYWPLRRLESDPGSRTPRPTGGIQRHSNTLFRLALEKTPFFILSLGSSAIAYFVQKNAGAVGSLDRFPVFARVQNAMVAYLHYLQTFFWPMNLVVIYPHPGNWPPLPVFAAAAGLVIVSFAAWVGRKKHPYFIFGWLWYLGALVPVIGLVQIGVQAYADRYTYVPMIGIVVALTWGVAEAVTRRKSRILFLSVAVPGILLGSIVTTSIQLQYWKNDEALFSHAIASTANNAVAQNNLGLALARQGNFRKSEELCASAAAIFPDSAEIWHNLGRALLGQKKYDEAFRAFSEAMRLAPNDPKIRIDLGVLLQQMGKSEEALAQFSEARRLDPQNTEAICNLALLLSRASDTIQQHAAVQEADQAITRLTETIRQETEPNFGKPSAEIFEAQVQLGALLLRQNKTAEGLRQWKEALKRKPDATLLLNNVAWIQATHPDPALRNGSEAVQLAQRACALAENPPGYLDTLAAAYAETGRFEDAIKTEEKAIGLVDAAAEREKARMQCRLDIYRSRRPYHQAK